MTRASFLCLPSVRAVPELARFRQANPVLTEQNEAILEPLRGIGHVE